MTRKTSDKAVAEAISAMTRRCDTGDVLDVLVTSCSEVYPAAAVAVLARDDRGGLQLMAATSHRSAELELLQQQQVAGPCVEAMTTAQVVTSTGELMRDRWGTIGDAVLRAGFSAVHAYPMIWRGSPLGGVNVFLAAEEEASEERRQVGQLFADLATLAVVHSGELPADALTSRIDEAFRARSVIEQAKGVIAYRDGVPPAAAYELLRERSRASGEALSAVARQVVASTSHRPTSEGEPRRPR